MAVESIIEIKDLVKRYKIKKQGSFKAIDGVSLKINKGEIFGLLGKNGAGKTTLIKVMAGLLEADGGSGKIMNFDMYKEHKRIRANVSLVAPTADVGTDNNLTVRQNLEFWAVVYNLSESERDKRIEYVLEFLELKDHEHFWPMSISAGMRQKLAIARSLLVQHPIIFLDEPTVKLDAKGAESIREFIKNINEKYGTTIILTTHYIFEAEELCDRVAIMDKGEIISCDTVDKLRSNLQKYDSFSIMCSEIESDLIDELQTHENILSCNYLNETLKVTTDKLRISIDFTLRLLRREGKEIYSVNTDEYSLEDVFTKMTGNGGA